MKPPKVRPTVRLKNQADMFLIISQVVDALKTAGADEDYVRRFKTDALYDYKTVIFTCYEYVNIAD
jgi:hypothetical protein